MTEQAHREEAVREEAEVPEEADLREEEGVAPERVRDPGENVCVQNAERLFPMKSGHPATLRNVRNAVRRW